MQSLSFAILIYYRAARFQAYCFIAKIMSLHYLCPKIKCNGKSFSNFG